jgi:hypothetical protein
MGRRVEPRSWRDSSPGPANYETEVAKGRVLGKFSRGEKDWTTRGGTVPGPGAYSPQGDRSIAAVKFGKALRCNCDCGYV